MPQRLSATATVLLLAVAATSAAKTSTSPMPSGNGHGFLVYTPATRTVTALYTHPYRFARQDPDFPDDDGIESTNLVKRMGWRGPGIKASARDTTIGYASESHVVQASDARHTQTFFLPFGVARNAAIVTIAGPNAATACLRIQWTSRPEEEIDRIAGRSVEILTFEDATVALVPLDASAQPTFGSCLGGSTGWAIVTVESAGELGAAVRDVVEWQHGAAAAALAAREVQEHDAWRVTPPPSLAGPARQLWRQSETVLRMGQIREPNRNGRYADGLILASLPSGEFFIPWVRDMAWATVALARMGHVDEARRALDAFLDARDVGLFPERVRGVPYQISTVRYFGDGAEEADYSGEDAPNVELDGWGLVLWAAGIYVEASGDTAWLSSHTYRGSVYANLRDFVAEPLLANVDAAGDGTIVAADTSCWEQNDLPRMHYACTTIAAIEGLRAFAALARTMNDTATASTVDTEVARLVTGFRSAFVRGGRLHGVVENSPKNDMDGALLNAINAGVETDPTIVASTLEAMTLLSVPSGGYRRVTGDSGYERQEFLFVDFALARAWLRVGRTTDADAMVSRIVAQSALDHFLVPEMYVSARSREFRGVIGAPTGSIPMVGFGAGAYVIYQLDRPEGA